MAHNWQELSRMTGGKEILVEKVRITESDIAIEGAFELPPLARLAWEDQIFIAAFVKAHGSIKEMERLFGVSYPTIKGRLNRISELLDFIRVDTNIEFEPVAEESEPAESGPDPLEMLDSGEIDLATALKMIKEKKK